MSWHEYVRRALAAPEGSAEVDEEVVEELAQHAQAARESARADGLDDEQADAHVGELLGAWCTELSRSPRRPRRPPLVQPPPAASPGLVGLAHDFRYGWRQIRRHPGFALGVAGTLALGVAAATTVFSFAYGVLMRPLPWPGADRLVRLTETRERSTRLLPPLITNATYLEWRRRHDTLVELAAWSLDEAMLETGAGRPQRAKVVACTASLFPLLEVRPALGRFFDAGEESPRRGRVAVLSHAAWQRRFGGDRRAIGRALRIDGRSYTVVGVLPDGKGFPLPEVELWIPLEVAPVTSAGDGGQWVALLEGVGRLAAGATRQQAMNEGTARGRAAPPLGLVGMAVFGADGPPVVAVEPLVAAWTAAVRPALLLLLGAVGLLVASAVANIAGMQLARALSRRRELAVRAAVGAGRSRLARQLLVENLLLGTGAGVVGVLISWWLHHLLPRLVPAGYPRLADVSLDAGVAAFGAALAVLAGLGLGLFPVALVRRLSFTGSLAGDGQLLLGGRLRLSVARAREVVMAAQVAVALVLLAGAGLLARSLWALWHADRGFEIGNLVTAQLSLPATAAGARSEAILDQVLGRVATLPGVRAAAVTNVLPLTAGESLLGFTMPGPDGRPLQVQAAQRVVGPGYFEALGMRRLAGRTLSEADRSTSSPAIVVNRAFVRAYLPRRALGAMLPAGMRPDGADWQVVGVVDDVRQQSADDRARPEVFVSYRQLQNGFPGVAPTLVVRVARDPRLVAALLRDVVSQAAPSVAVDAVMTMEERLSSSLARPRLHAVLLAAFAGLALLVTAVGLFGVLSYSVAQRWREFGVRAALGASPPAVAGLVLRQCATVTLAGIGGGLALSLAFRRAFERLLYGVGAADPLTWLLAAVLLVVVALLACLVPARHAARVDPVRALMS